MSKWFRLSCVAAVLSGMSSIASASLLRSDTFNYVDGNLPVVSNSTWSKASGNGDLNVNSGHVVIDDTNTENDSVALSGAFTTGSLYASFTINGETADMAGGSVGDYFANFVASGGTTSQEARIFAGKPTGMPGIYQLGVANFTSGVNNEIFLASKNLTAGTTYLVVMRYDIGNSKTTLWVNPTSESDTNFAQATDTTTNVGMVNAFMFRQGGTDKMGDYDVDNLRVGTSFIDVVPEPAVAGLLAVGSLRLLKRRR